MNKKYILIGAIGIIAVYFIYKKFSAKKTESAEKTESNESTEIPLSPLALKSKPTLKQNPYGTIIDVNSKPEFNETDNALSLENRINNRYC